MIELHEYTTIISNMNVVGNDLGMTILLMCGILQSQNFVDVQTVVYNTRKTIVV